jgi:hypothetical protein
MVEVVQPSQVGSHRSWAGGAFIFNFPTYPLGLRAYMVLPISDPPRGPVIITAHKVIDTSPEVSADSK